MPPASSKKATSHALIDADILAYVVADKAQRVHDFGDGEVSVETDSLDDCKPIIKRRLEELQDKLHTTHLVLTFSDGANFRKTILPTYKGNRKVKPVLLPAIKAWMSETWKTYVRPTLEGDDVMGILATSNAILRGDKIIVSVDKDMRQIPGTVYNDRREEFTTVTPEEADHWHFMQTLTGDATDNYKGCPGIGKVRAYERLADTSRTPWQAIVKAYEDHNLTEADALVQARVARILRKQDYDFKRKEPILWTPPNSSC